MALRRWDEIIMTLRRWDEIIMTLRRWDEIMTLRSGMRSPH